MISIQAIQQALHEAGLDGWLLADFQGRNSVAAEFLSFPTHLTRRFFYFVPASGAPVALVHSIERLKFTHLPGEQRPFTSFLALEQELSALLAGKKRIAMEYAPNGRLPYVGLVDAGTIELIRSFGCEVVSSADLASYFSARLTGEQIASHHRAASHLLQIKDAAFALIGEQLSKGARISEWDVVVFIQDQFSRRGLQSAYGPNCSVNANAGNPHYDPSAAQSEQITPGSLVLLDLWAQEKEAPGRNGASGPFADITWMAYCGTTAAIPEKYVRLFGLVAAARDAAVNYLEQAHRAGKLLYGADVDDAARSVMQQAGVAESFTHRTGHSITTSIHGSGPNIDNLETEDRRVLQVGHLFSVEPGLYYDDCGFRSEIDVLITPSGPQVTTLPLQREITPLLQ